MSIKQRLRDYGVINTHDLLLRFAKKGKDVACCYYPPDTRGVMAAKTQVYSPRYKTDPAGSWYNYGQKTFVGNKAESMPQAIAWASKRYGIREWVPDPTSRSTMIPLEVRMLALATVREKD